MKIGSAACHLSGWIGKDTGGSAHNADQGAFCLDFSTSDTGSLRDVLYATRLLILVGHVDLFLSALGEQGRV
jgi:hypothetical protein